MDASAPMRSSPLRRAVTLERAPDSGREVPSIPRLHFIGHTSFFVRRPAFQAGGSGHISARLDLRLKCGVDDAQGGSPRVVVTACRSVKFPSLARDCRRNSRQLLLSPADDGASKRRPHPTVRFAAKRFAIDERGGGNACFARQSQSRNPGHPPARCTEHGRRNSPALLHAH